MSQRPKNFTQAIDELEDRAGDAGLGDDAAESGDLRARIERELHRLEDLLKGMQPHMEDIAGQAKEKVKKNPAAAFGIVAIVAFLLGFILAKRRRH